MPTCYSAMQRFERANMQSCASAYRRKLTVWEVYKMEIALLGTCGYGSLRMNRPLSALSHSESGDRDHIGNRVGRDLCSLWLSFESKTGVPCHGLGCRPLGTSPCLTFCRNKICVSMHAQQFQQFKRPVDLCLGSCLRNAGCKSADGAEGTSRGGQPLAGPS